jgi:hypothetical protein
LYFFFIFLSFFHYSIHVMCCNLLYFNSEYCKDNVSCVIINKAPIFLNELYLIVVLFIFLITYNCLLNYLKFEL